MYPDLPLWLSIVCVLGGFAVLAWSADAFVDGASVTSQHFPFSGSSTVASVKGPGRRIGRKR